jgi:CelD/BcsL family acetyltransferase involved in cellulose biosynthesis
MHRACVSGTRAGACTTQAAAPTHRLGRFALAALRARRLVAGGIDDATLGALRGACRFVHVNRFGPAPYVDLARLRATGRDFLDGRSANTRQQLRRSDRAYAVDGPLTVTRAETLDQAMADLDALIPLHQATWTARGKAGAFANPFFTRFHRALIARALPLGQVDLLRVSAGNRLIGVLYNFRYRGHALAYQSGFAYEAGDHRRKPGLTSHHQAIRLSLAACLDRYDFLSGADRYKLSLSDGATPIYWAEDGWTPRLLGRWAHTLLSRCRRGAETDAPNRHRRDPSLVP